MPDGRPNLTVTRALMRLWFPGRLGLRGALGGFAIVLILLYGVFAACYPWDYSLTFGPTLTGTWLGELQDQKGHRRAALLDLERESSDRIWNNLTGTLRLCGAAERRAFNVTGDTRNWRGTRLWFETALDETGDGQGPQVSRAEGEWDGGDTLRLSTTLTWYRVTNSPRGTSIVDEPAAPAIAVTLGRGSERQFAAACERLERAAPGTRK